MAPVVHECRRQRRPDRDRSSASPGQHRQMLDQVTDYFGIEVDRDLDLMPPNQTLAEVTARCLTGLDAVLAEYRPDCVVAQGDTTTVMAAALAAFYRRVPFVHVEAGLRTGNLQAPWPEELNRRIASLVTALHCAPTPQAAENLLARRRRRRGRPRHRQHGDRRPAVDRRPRARPGPPLAREIRRAGRPPHGADHRPPPRELRRRHGADLPRSSILARRFPDVEFVYPVHLNPERPRAGAAGCCRASRTSTSASRRPIPSSSG